MHWKRKKRNQLIVILGLSLMVFLCLLLEAQRKELFSGKESGRQESGTKKEEKKTASKETERITEDTEVKVLIMSTNFASLFHKKIKITSEHPFSVTVDGVKKEYGAGKAVTYSADNKALKGKKILFTPSKNARLKVISITRQNRYPSYRGTMKITWKKQGLMLTNQLPLEEYLYAVVPSELSTGNKMEALKAQAICARSYTYRQIRSNRYEKYHAHLDDSVAFQVYNNIPEDKRSRKAVNATKGLVLTNKGKVLVAYYYSTSWGYSASGQDVWNTKSRISYLPEKLQITDEAKRGTQVQNPDLSDEREFQRFIEEEPYETYDSSADWYRWKVIISRKSLSNRIDAMLQSCYQSSPEQVLTQQADGSYRREKLKPLGTVKKIRIEERKKSGLVTEVVFVGTKNVVKVCTQYNIRKALTPLYEQISYQRGASATTMNLLPSAAFYIRETIEGKQKLFCFIGGGFGHGAGMSQCGAAEMAKRGKTYPEILTHYFAGADITPISKLK